MPTDPDPCPNCGGIVIFLGTRQDREIGSCHDCAADLERPIEGGPHPWKNVVKGYHPA